MNAFKPVPTPIPPTRTPRPSPTPSIFTGEPKNYLPIFPYNFDVDISSQHEQTYVDGKKLFSVIFNNNKQNLYNGNLIGFVYQIRIYPTEGMAIADRYEYITDLGGDGVLYTPDIGLEVNDGVDETTLYITVGSDGTIQGEYASRTKNVFITTLGFTTYNSQTVTEEFIKNFVEGDLLKIHLLGINKFLK